MEGKPHQECKFKKPTSGRLLANEQENALIKINKSSGGLFFKSTRSAPCPWGVWVVCCASEGGEQRRSSPAVQRSVLGAPLLLDLPVVDRGIRDSVSYQAGMFFLFFFVERGFKFSPGGDKLPPDPIFYNPMM